MTTTRQALFRRGDETNRSTYWLGSRSSQSIPTGAILTESGLPVTTELGQYLETET